MQKRTKFSIIFIFIFFVLILIAFIFAAKWTKEFRKIINTEGAVEFAKANDIVITETKDGIKSWEVYAAKGEYDAQRVNAVLTDIVGNYYQENEVVMSFTAPTGTYNADTKKITLDEKVRVVGKDNVELLANKLYWITTEDKIHAEGEVIVNQNNEIITLSNKAAATTDFDFFEIFDNTELRVYKENENKEGILK